MWNMWYIVIVAGWLACTAASYLAMRGLLRYVASGYTTGDRFLNLGFSLLGPVTLVAVLMSWGIALLVRCGGEARL